jgi:hypothetical protein
MRQPSGATVNVDEERRHPNMHLHFIARNGGGRFDHSRACERFSAVNTSHAFDIVHLESMALPRSSDDRQRHRPGRDPQAGRAAHAGARAQHDQPPHAHRRRGPLLPNYRHHVATSDYVGDVLRTICDVARVFRGPAWFSHCHVEMPSLDAGLLVIADVVTLVLHTYGCRQCLALGC